MQTNDELTEGASSVTGGATESGVSDPPRHVVLRLLAAHPRWVQTGIWTFVVGSSLIGVGLWVGGFLEISDVGYFATFYLNLVGAATIFLPLPGVLAACVAADASLGLQPLLIAFAGAAGATLGETTAYLAGFAGQNVAARSRWYARIRDYMERHGALTLFIVSSIPTPFFDLAGIAAGALGYPYRRFVLYVMIGKFVRLTIMVYACRLGIGWLQDVYEFNLPIG